MQFSSHLRKSSTISCINSEGEIDVQLKKFSPLFFGLYQEQLLSGVVSVCQTDDDEFRLRGICIAAEFRNYGLSNALINTAIKHILQQNSNSIIWTLAREANLNFYSHFGFEEYKRVTNFEYGPHIILKNISPQNTLARLMKVQT